MPLPQETQRLHSLYKLVMADIIGGRKNDMKKYLTAVYWFFGMSKQDAEMFKNLKKAIISNGWKFPEKEVKKWYARHWNGCGDISSGVVQTRHYGKIYFSIISPWMFCPEGIIEIKRV